jgi:ribonuclease HI
VWIPGHQGIPGNEEADRLANARAVEVPPNQLTFSVGKTLIKKRLEPEHQAWWTAVLAAESPKC